LTRTRRDELTRTGDAGCGVPEDDFHASFKAMNRITLDDAMALNSSAAAVPDTPIVLQSGAALGFFDCS